jgi:MFS family permease
MCQRAHADRLLPEDPSSDALRSTRVGPDGSARDPSRVYACGRSANRNVAWTWCLTLAMGLSDSIWGGTVLVKFLNSLLGNNAYVGYIEAASGAANLIVALPVGWAADWLGKARVARCGGMLIPLALGVTAFAVAYGTAHPPTQESETVWMLGLFIGAMCLWGTVNAVANGPAQVLRSAPALQHRPRRPNPKPLPFLSLLFPSTSPAMTSVGVCACLCLSGTVNGPAQLRRSPSARLGNTRCDMTCVRACLCRCVPVGHRERLCGKRPA